jgi:hypothetical protein
MALQLKLNIKGQHRGGKNMFGWATTSTEVRESIMSNVPSFKPHVANGVECVRAYNLNKVRRKWVKFDKPKKMTKKEIKAYYGYIPTDVDPMVYGELVHPTHWVGTFYDIPVVVLKMLGLRVEQGRNTYKLVPTKK